MPRATCCCMCSAPIAPSKSSAEQNCTTPKCSHAYCATCRLKNWAGIHECGRLPDYIPFIMDDEPRERRAKPKRKSSRSRDCGGSAARRSMDVGVTTAEDGIQRIAEILKTVDEMMDRQEVDGPDPSDTAGGDGVGEKPNEGDMGWVSGARGELYQQNRSVTRARYYQAAAGKVMEFL